MVSLKHIPPPMGIDNDISLASIRKTRVSKKRPRKKVGFADAATYRVSVLEHITDEERANVWYSQRDYSVIGKEARAIVKNFRKGRCIDTICFRGLEKYRSSRFHGERKMREMGHYRSILQEHRRQKMEGAQNPKVLRMLSTINSRWARENAQALAQQDEREVMRIEQDDDSFAGETDDCFLLGEMSDSDESESSMFTISSVSMPRHGL